MYAETKAVWLLWSESQTSAITDPQIYMREGTAVATAGEYYFWPTWVQAHEENAEQRRARYRQQADYEERARNAVAARKAASERAERLLEACLTSEQRDQLRKENCFTVRGRSGNIYQIRRGRARNVFELKSRRTYCCHPCDGVPDPDTMLSQKLMIETQEHEFLRLANVS